MRVFLVNDNNELAISLAKKLENARHGQFIFVTPEELKFFKSGNLAVLDIPEDLTSTKITLGATASKVSSTIGKIFTTGGQKLQDNAPESPASE